MLRSPLWLTFVVGLFVGCFKDAAAGDDGGGCSEGSQGCACYGNGTCDGGLECSMGVCVPEGCTPGQELCTCVDGECLGGLVCVEGTCNEPPDETGTESDEGTSDSTDTGMETTVSTDTAATMTMTDTAEVSTTVPETCDDLGDCVACQDCANFGDCMQAFNDCVNNIDCANFGDCLDACGDDQQCVDACQGQYPEGAPIYFNYFECICQTCWSSCGPSSCGG